MFFMHVTMAVTRVLEFLILKRRWFPVLERAFLPIGRFGDSHQSVSDGRQTDVAGGQGKSSRYASRSR